MSQNLLVLGASVVDRILVPTSLLEHPAADTSVFIQPGGKGYNQAHTASRMGAHVEFLTVYNSPDHYGRIKNPALSSQANESLPGTRWTVRLEAGPTPEVEVLVSRDGEHRIIACPASDHRLTKTLLDERRDAFVQADWLLLQNEYPAEAVNHALAIAAGNRVRTIFNYAPWRAEPAIDLTGVEFLVVNEREAAGILGVSDYKRVLLGTRITAWNRFPVKHVFVTLGVDGGEWIGCEGQYVRFPPPMPPGRFSFGAGDTFCGTLAAELSRGAPIHVAAAHAHKAAAWTSRQPPGSLRYPDRSLLAGSLVI